MTPETPKFDRIAAKITLLQHRGSMTKIARDLGVSHAAISMFLSGKHNSPRVEEAVRKAVEDFRAGEPA